MVDQIPEEGGPSERGSGQPLQVVERHVGIRNGKQLPQRSSRKGKCTFRPGQVLQVPQCALGVTESRRAQDLQGGIGI